MAKKLDSPCLFCGGLPCTCDGGTKKKSSPRTRKAASPKVATSTTETSPSSTPPSSATAADTEDVFGAIPTQAKPKFKIARTSTDRDLSYESALRLLRELCSGPTRRGIDAELNHPYPQDVDRRVAQWKGRKR